MDCIEHASAQRALTVDPPARQEVDACLPFMRKRVSNAQRSQKMLRQIFPSYVFAQYAENFRWRPTLPTSSVKKVVRNTDRPGLLKHRTLSAALCLEGSAFKLGQRVESVSGALVVLAGGGTLEARERLSVLIELLNCSKNIRLIGDMVAGG
jgi:hypothetical protein